MDWVFTVQHRHVLPGRHEDVKIIGIYRTHAAAKAAIELLKDSPAFYRTLDAARAAEVADGFRIAKWPLQG
jgi:hypothetical protein